MALLSLTMPLGFHGVPMAPQLNIRMSFLDGKPGTVAIPEDFPGQVLARDIQTRHHQPSLAAALPASLPYRH